MTAIPQSDDDSCDTDSIISENDFIRSQRTISTNDSNKFFIPSGRRTPDSIVVAMDVDADYLAQEFDEVDEPLVRARSHTI